MAEVDGAQGAQGVEPSVMSEQGVDQGLPPESATGNEEASPGEGNAQQLQKPVLELEVENSEEFFDDGLLRCRSSHACPSTLPS